MLPLSCVVILISAIISLLYASRFITKLIRNYKLVYALPGPKRTPVIGNLKQFISDPVTFFKQLREWSRDYGPLYVTAVTIFWPGVNVTGSVQLEKVIGSTKNIKKGGVYLFLSRWLGEGLLTSAGSKWFTRRKILTHAVHFNILQQFVTIFNKETKRLVEVLETETKKPWTNVIPLISLFTLYSIAETSMGTSINFSSEEDKKFIAATFEITKILSYRIFRPWTYFSFIFYNFQSKGKQEKHLINILHSFTNDIIAKKTKTFEKFDVPTETNFNYTARKRLAFLDLLLNAKVSQNIIDDQGIKDEVNTFMFEGYDTTSMSICFTLMLLANHQQLQQQIYQEMLSVIGDTDRDPDINDLNDLKFMERFIKESLRLYPSVPYIARTLEEDTLIDGYLLPKNEMIHILIFDIHRNAKDWPEPEKFDPDRFLPDNCVGRHPFAYVPFSGGPRNCIGQKFAMLELKAAVFGILKSYILEPVDTPETVNLIPDVVLRPHNDILKVKFSKRHL